MGLLKLISNRISTEWKETFNKNVDYLNNLENKLTEKDKSTNNRIDNLVLRSSGDSPNEVIDARVNNKGETFETLHGRLTAHENLSDEGVDKLTVDLSNQKDQVEQLNDIIARLYGANGTNYEIYVSADSGNDATGTGEQDKPFKTIQVAVNQIPLINRSNVIIYIDSGVYLEDVVVTNVSASRLYIRSIQDDSLINGNTNDLPVKIRSIAFMYCTGYFQVRGIEFVDQANAPVFFGRRYSIAVEQGSYVAVNHCSFKENTKSLTHNSIYAGGISNVNIYGNTTFINQSIIGFSYLMAQITFNAIQGSGNDVLAHANQGLIRTSTTSLATTPTKTESTGLIITKGTVL
ncbi:hypothetical protein [Enterococcus sp. DIV0240a]|jgi:hypothetical protein|uniref:hypothetical protein n=1 Tax=unclassified Enterococcus TaxID=2608891 RepID=UPI003D2B4553